MSDQARWTFSPARAAAIAVAMMEHSDLDETTIKQLAFALAECEEKWNAAKKADAPTVTVSRLALYTLLMTAASYAGMTNTKAPLDPSLS